MLVDTPNSRLLAMYEAKLAGMRERHEAKMAEEAGMSDAILLRKIAGKAKARENAIADIERKIAGLRQVSGYFALEPR